MSEITLEIPLKITISLGAATSEAVSAPASLPATAASGLERVDIDPDYEQRRGYQSNFLGIDVPLPTLTEEQRRNAAKNSLAGPREDNTVLPYHHFSVVMNRRRQLAYYTAVNIDGARRLKDDPPRNGDRWYFDPRIAQSEQIGEELYARNALDRGHLVRRLDPAWGTTAKALRANNDTFHFTNCSPQHERFNQNAQTWAGIENYLLGAAVAEHKKLTVFTGPVLTEEDPLYRGVRLPLRFWKIAVGTKPNTGLSVSAYLLDQEDLVAGLERFDSTTFQVTVEEIQQRTGLDFAYLVQAQVHLDQAGTEGLERTGDLPRRRLNNVTSIQG